MTDLATVPGPGDHLARLLHAYLDGLRSPNTADTYRRDITHWLCWCADRGVNPLTAWPAALSGLIRKDQQPWPR